MHLHVDALARDRVAALAPTTRHQGPRGDRRDHVTMARRALARAFAAISLASAAAVRRLDACLADDLVVRRPEA